MKLYLWWNNDRKWEWRCIWWNNDRKWEWNCTYDGMALLAHVLPLSSRLYLISQLWRQINKKTFNLLRFGSYWSKKKRFVDVSPWRCIHGRGLSPGSWWSQGPPIPATRSHSCHSASEQIAQKRSKLCCHVVTNYNSCRKCQNSPFHTFRSRSTRDARLTA